MPFTPDTFTNQNITGTSTVAGGSGGLGTALNPSDTTLRLPTGHGSRFPAIAPFSLQLGTTEIAKCTLRSSDTLTIVRAQEGTTAGNWSVGTTVQQVLTAGNLSDVFSAVQVAALGIYNVRSATYGAVGDGVTDDTSAIQAAANAVSPNGIIVLPSGTYKVSAPITIATPGVTILGAGLRATRIQPSASFSGAAVLSISASYCQVRDLELRYANTTYSGNPAADAILLTGAEDVRITNVSTFYFNGYGINTSACSYLMLDKIHNTSGLAGIHLLSDNAHNWVGQATLSNIANESMGGDGILVEDFNDVMAVNWAGYIHVKGHCSSIFFDTVDIGGSSSAGVLVESGTNGTPSEVRVSNGIVQACAPNISVTAGEFHGQNLRIKGGSVSNVTLSGLTTVSFEHCNFSTANQSGNATAYDLDITAASGTVSVQHCRFESGIGAPTAGKVTTPVHDNSGIGRFKNNNFAGSGQTVTTVFTGTPNIAKDNDGYNPFGSFSNGADPGSGNNWPTLPYPVMVYIHGGTMSSIKIGGSSTGMSATNTSYYLPPNTALNITYSVAPTLAWFGV